MPRESILKNLEGIYDHTTQRNAQFLYNNVVVYIKY